MPEIGIKIEIDQSYLRELGQVNGEIKRVASEGRRSLTGLGNGLDSVGTAISRLRANFAVVLVGAVVAAGAAFASATAQAAEYERAIAEVQTISDTTVFTQQRIRDINLEVASTYGSNVRENARALYQTISAGITDVTQAQSLLRSASTLSIGGVTDLTTAVDGLTSVVNAYSASGLTAEDATDSLFTAIRTGKTTAEELSASLGQVAPIAAQVGVQFDELVGGIAAITTQGVSTSEAVTQLRSALTGVIKDTPQAQRVAKELGIDFSVAALRAEGLAGFLQRVVVESGATEQQLLQLFGRVEALNAVLNLTANSSAAFNASLQAQADRAGAGQAALDRMSETLAFQQDRFTALTDAAVNSLGTIVADSDGAREALGSLNDLIENGVTLLQSDAAASFFDAMVTGAGIAVSAVTPLVDILKTAGGLFDEFSDEQEELAGAVQVNQGAGQFRSQQFTGELREDLRGRGVGVSDELAARRRREQQEGRARRDAGAGAFAFASSEPFNVDETIAALSALADAELALKVANDEGLEAASQERQQVGLRLLAMEEEAEARAEYLDGLAAAKRREGELLLSTVPIQEAQTAAIRQTAATIIETTGNLVAATAAAAGEGATAGDLFRQFIGGLVQSLGAMLIQLGTAAISAGALGTVAPAIFGALAPPALIGVGAAALAVGAGVVAAGAAIKAGGTPGATGAGAAAGGGGAGFVAPTSPANDINTDFGFDSRFDGARGRQTEGGREVIYINQPIVGNPDRFVDMVDDLASGRRSA